MPPPQPAAQPVGSADDLVPPSGRGRVFAGTRRVRLGDVSPGGRLRLDALACFSQDLSNDDTVDAGLEDDMAWVARRTAIEVHAEAQLREELEMLTFCGGLGSAWAERRVSVRGEHGAHFEIATLWVYIDIASSRPQRLPEQFLELFGEAAAGRQVKARLRHGAPPPVSVSLPASLPGLDGASESAPNLEPWPLRFSDFDVLGHVNNAAVWQVVEEERARRKHLRAPLRAEVEHRDPIERGADVRRVTQDLADGALALWLVEAADPGRVYVSATLSPAVAPPFSRSGS